MGQQIFIGKSSIEYLSYILQEISPKNIFLVRGKKSYKSCGAETAIKEAISSLNCKIIEFYDFSENPKFEDMETGLSLLSNSDIDVILGIGGGSVLDMSKLIRFFYSYSRDITNFKFRKQKELLPLIAIPTTAGTGSETTHFAVLYKDKIKYSVTHEEILPNFAIVYPPFTYNNPKYLTACTGFDALAQAIEAYWNINATKKSDEYALKAIDFLWKNLPEVNCPAIEIRDMVSEGSYWAGKAINITKTTAPHAFSYPFTTLYGYPHGHAVAMTFPFWAEYNISFLRDLLPDKADILLSILNINKNNICSEFINYIINNISLDLHLPPTFSLDTVLANVNLERLKNNPGDLNIDIIRHKIENYFMNLKKEYEN
jgi:alcohol dehydrogenase class IV